MLIIFDCDGVLIDSEHIAARIEANAANSLGHPITEKEILEEFVGRPSRYIWEKVKRELGRELPPDFLTNHQMDMANAFALELRQMTGITNALESLQYEKCVASSTEKTKLVTNLKTTGLFNYFGDCIFSASQVERAKPFPDLFIFAAKNMGFKPNECLVIEDSIAGVCAARAASMKVIGFLGGTHLQGEQLKNGHRQKLLDNGAIDTFDNMEDFHEIIARHV